MKKHQNASRWTIFIFGFLAFVLGLSGLKDPKNLLKQMGFKAIDSRAEHDYTEVFVMTSSMASTNMGIYYMLAAIFNVRRFFAWTVPFRIVTFSIFSTAVFKKKAPARFLMVAVWELVGALLTGWALWREKEDKWIEIE